MKPTLRFAFALAGLMAATLPAAAAGRGGAQPPSVTIADGNENVMVSDGGAMTSASANQAIAEGQMFTVSMGGSATLSEGGSEYALGPGTYSVGADGAILDGAGNPVAEAGAGTPGPAGAGAGATPIAQNIFGIFAGVNPLVESLVFTGTFLGITGGVIDHYNEIYARAYRIGPYATSF